MASGARLREPSSSGAAEAGPRRWPLIAPFVSILSHRTDVAAPDPAEDQPEYFADLHLDEIVGSIVAGREVYDLVPFFQVRSPDLATVAYRHEVLRDLEDGSTLDVVREFAHDMGVVRDHLARAAASHYRYEAEWWFLDAADTYTVSISRLAEALERAAIRSRGLIAFRRHLAEYVAGSAFRRLGTDATTVRAALDAIRYRLHIDGSRITVGRHDSAADLGAEVLRTFEKFRQGEGRQYRFTFTNHPDMNHVEAEILDRVARLFPEAFAALDTFRADHAEFLDPTIVRFDREIQFYVAYLEYIASLRRAGSSFCYPEVTERFDGSHGRDAFDLALAAKLAREGARVVPNDFVLQGPERILVVSGPNSGGKTTFARMIGQLHHLAALGLLVPGSSSRLPLVDRIFTHFEREETVEDLSGKLEDDLRRIHRILAEATAGSLLIMNESFSSTTLHDQLIIGRRVMRSIIERGMVCVAVTFLDELASLDRSTVSMVGTVDPAEPARRTFRIERRPADGLAYALAIAEKHRLTYRGLDARLGR